MKKIIHFSDLHIGYEDLEERFSLILMNMMFTKQPPEDYIIVITGDLVNNAYENGAHQKAFSYVESLCKTGYRVLVVPGNHDYGNGVCSDKKFVPLFKNIYFKNPDIIYPKLDIAGDQDGDLAFIGLDSMEEELNFFDRIGADGELGEAQLQRLDLMLSSPEVRNCLYRIVYLHHHPFETGFSHKLKDSEALGRLIMKYNQDKESPYVHALLYGHMHHGKKRNGAWNIPRCYDGGSTTKKQDAPGEHRVIDPGRDARWDYDADFHGNY